MYSEMHSASFPGVAVVPVWPLVSYSESGGTKPYESSLLSHQLRHLPPKVLFVGSHMCISLSVAACLDQTNGPWSQCC